MDLPGSASARKAIALLGAIIVVGGFAIGLVSGLGAFGRPSNAGSGLPYGTTTPVNANASESFANDGSVYTFAGIGGSSTPTDSTQIVGNASPSTAGHSSGTSLQTGGSVNGTGGNNLGSGSLLEFSSDLTIQATSPEGVASSVVALAYSVGGYVAYQSTYTNSAYIVIRVPASEYQSVLTQVRAMGSLVSLVSNSNDVSVQYTDLNATLASLRTEENSLLKLLNESASINSTLAIEGQLQSVDQQIDATESQILQTSTLVQYSTIDVTVDQLPQNMPLTVTLKAGPENGTAPLAVTFDAIVNGGAPPYIVNYNFGDGSSYQGQILIHTYYQSGTYRVTVTATDQNGTVVVAIPITIKVQAAATTPAVVTFFGNVANLFVGVVEGIVEVAVVVLPLAGVVAIVVIPLRRRFWPAKDAKQTQ